MKSVVGGGRVAICLFMLVSTAGATADTLSEVLVRDVDRLATLDEYTNVADNVIEAFARGESAVEVYVTVKGFDVDPPFYRPVIDDPPDRRRESFFSLLRLLRDSGVQDGLVIDSDPEVGVGLFRLDLRQVERVAAFPRTFAISVPQSGEALLQAAVPRTKFPAVHALGLRGQGVKVAVIDTSFMAGALNDVIVERHCFCGSVGAGCCNNGSHEQHSGANAATLPGTSPYEHHAVFVSSVVANSNNGGGGAPGAGIVAIGTRVSSSTPDRLNALQWLQGRSDVPIINMSWSHGVAEYPGVCDGAPEQAVLLARTSALHSAGRTLVAAAGNDENAYGMRAPACLSTTIAVAGTWNCTYPSDPGCPPGGSPNVNHIYPQSNTSPETDVSAPGARVWLHYPATGGGYLSPGTGTSFAAPLVAACAAVLKQAVPLAGPEQLRAAIRATAASVTNPANSQNYRFLDCEKSLDHLLASTGIRLNQHGLTGTWYNPLTAGQGIVMEVYQDAVSAGNGTVFGGFFTFAAAPAGGYDKQRWYTFSGGVNNASKVANLTIYADYGGNFNAPPPTSALAVGSATMHFDTCNRGTLTYSFHAGVNGGASGAIPLHRNFANPGCSETGAGSTSSRFKLSGAWHRASTPGQGLVLEVSPGSLKLFGGWFTYAPNGQAIGGPASQRWYTLQADLPVSGNTIAGIPIYGTTSGILDDPDPVVTTQVGSATLSFTSCSVGTLSYNFTSGPNAGLSGSIGLSRAGPVPAGCTL